MLSNLTNNELIGDLCDFSNEDLCLPISERNHLVVLSLESSLYGAYVKRQEVFHQSLPLSDVTEKNLISLYCH